jgi:nucleotide-binding universal stress UspA family protein
MRKILVAIDGSDTSLRALDFAVQQARLAPAAELHVLTVQPLASTYTAWEIYVSAEKLREISTTRARGILDTAAGRLRIPAASTRSSSSRATRPRPSRGAPHSSAASPSRWARAAPAR